VCHDLLMPRVHPTSPAAPRAQLPAQHAVVAGTPRSGRSASTCRPSLGKSVAPYLPTIIAAVWRLFISMAPVYDASVVPGLEIVVTRGGAGEGVPRETLAEQVFDFFLTVLDTGAFRGHLTTVLEELLYYTIAFMQARRYIPASACFRCSRIKCSVSVDTDRHWWCGPAA
jgi:hypothetical protein